MFKIPQKIEYVIENLCKNGFEAYIVGGCVRDMLLGSIPHDFDVTTSAKPHEIQAIFQKTVPTGIKHGTITVIVDGTPVEVTTFRKESEYKDHRRPDSVEFVSDLAEDLSRRDFTVNAFAYNNSIGLVDYFNGKTDLENKILRAVGEPQKRFNEDALRILRLFRFASVLGFSCEEKTLNAAIEYSKTLKSISSERIFTELYKAVTGENFSLFSPLIDCGGLEFLSIKNNPDYSLIKKLRHNTDLAFFGFIYLSGADIPAVLKKLKVSNKLYDYCLNIEKLLKTNLPQTKPAIKKLLCNFSTSIFNDMLFFRKEVYHENTLETEELFSQVLKDHEPYLVSHLEIDGKKIMEMGFSGKEVGKVLQYLQEIIINDPNKNNSEILIKEIKKINRN